ncbi:DUF2591 family protein [Rahnella sp. FC061912-K]|uniref:phage protein NinX family protein n=1 Tax=Rahnella rivi TaxID=2816249 RepID=UPI001C257A01|nr:phage protein NinX family protein [Rahnella rivi]MBU9829863.1 DUF2591 family protein [Rahnella rivi]
MKDYSAMSDHLINQQVAESLAGRYLYFQDYVWDSEEEKRFNPCNYPADAWPIIYGNLITIEPDYEFIDESEAEVFPTGLWIAERSGNHEFLQHVNESPLRAAMIVYLMMKDAEKCDG